MSGPGQPAGPTRFYQIAFVRLTNRFPAQQPLEVIEELLAYVGAQVGIDPDHISAYEQRRQTISEHQGRIRRHLRLRTLWDDERKLVEAFLFEQCCRLEQIAALRAQAEQFFRDQRIVQPATSALDRMIGEQRRKARVQLFERVTAILRRNSSNTSTACSGISRRGGPSPYREAKYAFFESLIPQAPAVLLPREDLEAIANAVVEDKPVPREGIVTESLAEEGAEAVEGLA